MDYEFEAPRYVNFANAMDEDDLDVSKYFDVEHEHNLREPRVKIAPLDILPKGIRSFATTSEPNRGSSLKSTRTSHRTDTPYGQHSATKLKEPSVSTPTRVQTRNSLKRTPVSSSPSTQYADCLTPGVKRLRSSTENTPEGTPSKRLKSTPGVILNALANIQLSPASVTANTMLQDAVQTLDRIGKSAKKATTPARRLSVVDGINVELKAEKGHQMETRGDKQQRQAPLHLRSRSVPRSQQNRSPMTSPPKSKPDLKSHVRARSVSKDRSGPSSRIHNEPDRYVSLSDVLNKIQSNNSSRFKPKKNAPSKLTNGPLKPLRATVPTGSDIEFRLRNRTTTSESTTSIRTLNGTPGNVLKPVNSIEKKTPTVPVPFNLTEVRKKEVTPNQPFKFTARPAPKSVTKPSYNGVSPKKGVTPSKSKTPTPHKKMLSVIEVKQTGERVLRDRNVVTGVGIVPKRQLTEPKPFSFDVREQERQARKAARLQEKIEAEIRGRPQFQANPLPAFAAPRKRSPSPFSASRKRSPSPFSRKPGVPIANGIGGNHVDRKPKDTTIPPVKAPLAPTFRARAPVVLAKKPFEPVKPQRQLPLPSVTLASEMRAKEREEFDKKQAEKEEEIQAIIKRQKEEQERRERDATLKLRKELVHKAKPIPDIKPFEPQPSDRPLTDPKTPFCLKRSVLSSR